MSVGKSVFHTISIGGANCFLLRAKDGYLLIDTGYPGKTHILWEYLEENGINPGDIKYILLTHAHYDHCGGVYEVKRKTGAKVIIHKDELEEFKRGYSGIPEGINFWGEIVKMFFSFKKAQFQPVDADIIVERDMSLIDMGIGGKIVHTPGHTKGSISVVLDSGEAFVGDLCMNVANLLFKKGLPVFAEDKKTLVKSWEKLIDCGVRVIYPSHGEEFGVEWLVEVWERLKVTEEN